MSVSARCLPCVDRTACWWRTRNQSLLACESPVLPCCGLSLHCCPPCLLCDVQQMTRAECSALPVLPCCNPRPGPLACACASHQHVSHWAAGPGCQCAQHHWKFRQGLDWLCDCMRPTACAASAPPTTCPATALVGEALRWPESIPSRLVSNPAACACVLCPAGAQQALGQQSCGSSSHLVFAHAAGLHKLRPGGA